MTPRPITRGDLHARLPLAGHEALIAYAEREGISLNTALWLLVRRGLEQEGIRVEVGGRRSEPSAPERAPSAAGAAVDVGELVEQVHHGEVGRRLPAASAPSSSTPPPGPGHRRRRRRR